MTLQAGVEPVGFRIAAALDPTTSLTRSLRLDLAGPRPAPAAGHELLVRMAEAAEVRITLAPLQCDAQQHADQVPRTRNKHRDARAVGHSELDVQAGGEACVQGAGDGCD